jgi:hypothetical protein
MEIIRIPKLIIPVGKFFDKNYSVLHININTYTCNECGSHLMYVRKEKGVIVDNEPEYGIGNYRKKRHYDIRTVGYSFYCAECGDFRDNTYTKIYNDEDIIEVLSFADEDEYMEIRRMLQHYNENGEFKQELKDVIEAQNVKDAIEKYEKENPINLINKKTTEQKLEIVKKGIKEIIKNPKLMKKLNKFIKEENIK